MVGFGEFPLILDLILCVYRQAFSFANTRWAKNGPCRIK